MSQVKHGKITVALGGVIALFRNVPAADEFLMKAIVVEENPCLGIVIGPQVFDRFDLADKLCQLPDEKRGMEIADDHNGTAGVTVLNLRPYALVMGLEKGFPDTPPPPDFAAMDEEYLSRIVLGKDAPDLPVKAERRDVDLNRAGHGTAGRGFADPKGVPVAASGDGLAVKPDTGILHPVNVRPDALPLVTDPHGNPLSHQGPQHTDELTLATPDGRFIVQDFEHP
jgi:hypothetical protein